MVDISKLQSASSFAGLQNLGTVTAAVTISGAVLAGSYLSAYAILAFPVPDVISSIRLQYPNGSGDLANYWYPVCGSLELVETNCHIIINVISDPQGRRVLFNFVNQSSTDINVVNRQFNLYAHMYSYAW